MRINESLAHDAIIILALLLLALLLAAWDAVVAVAVADDDVDVSAADSDDALYALTETPVTKSVWDWYGFEGLRNALIGLKIAVVAAAVAVVAFAVVLFLLDDGCAGADRSCLDVDT